MLSMVVCTCNTNSQKFDVGKLGVTGQPELQSKSLPLKNTKESRGGNT